MMREVDCPCDATGIPYIFESRLNTHRKFYGMASKTAQEKHHGGVADYRASEGKEVLVPYRGKVENTVKHILGGLRGSCALQGINSLSDSYSNSHFVRVNRQVNNVFGN